jgi:energy-coupling factor transport system permease protein
MNNIALGRYLPIDSLVHKMDPRFKLWAMFLILVAIFVPAGYYGHLTTAIFLITAMLLSKIPFDYIAKGLKPMMFMMIFLLVINVLVIQTGTVLISYNGFTIYWGAINQTMYIVIRLVLMITTTTILTATTKPLDLTLGIEESLKPFKRFGVPTHEISMMISIALRFIPTIIEEAFRILKAQQSRGVDMEEGKLKEKVVAILSLIIPLFIACFQRAEDLANAMEARGYNPQGQRTRYRQLKIATKDIVLMVVSVSFLIVNISLAIYL